MSSFLKLYHFFDVFYYRAKEWLVICERPDLMRRVDIGDITINNYYVCETHFPNQILDYATRKILIKTAKPLSVVELKAMPTTNRHGKNVNQTKSRRRSDEYDAHIVQDYDDEEEEEEEDDDDDNYEIEDSKGTRALILNVQLKIRNLSVIFLIVY